MERFDEEEWLLRDVIFVEDTRPVPIGEVLAVDGNQVFILLIYIISVRLPHPIFFLYITDLNLDLTVSDAW